MKDFTPYESAEAAKYSKTLRLNLGHFRSFQHLFSFLVNSPRMPNRENILSIKGSTGLPFPQSTAI
jgi:hypothetical protein